MFKVFEDVVLFSDFIRSSDEVRAMIGQQNGLFIDQNSECVNEAVNVNLSN